VNISALPMKDVGGVCLSSPIAISSSQIQTATSSATTARAGFRSTTQVFLERVGGSPIGGAGLLIPSGGNRIASPP
jgi:hypothetical protein